MIILSGKRKFILVLAVIFFIAEIGFAETYRSSYTPWSGYWWPSRMGGLATGNDYRGNPAPIEKYLMLSTGNENGALLSWYKNRYFDTQALPWAGLCGYWARASVFESYNILPSSEDNIIFRVGDKKGLLSLCHDADTMVNASDATADQFHFWLLSYIRDQKVPFIADLGTNQEVWYYPVYRYDMSKIKAGALESVTVTIYYTRNAVFPDFMGTYEGQATYTYNLILNDSGDIVDGAWTGDSVNNHPKKYAYPLISKPKSPDIDCNEVERIARASDDFLEVPGNQSVSILPGSYHLVLMNEDRYFLEFRPGDEVYLEIIKEDGSDEVMDIQLLDESSIPVMSRMLLGSGGSVRFNLGVQDPQYTLILSQKNYSDPNIYTLMINVSKPFQQNVPYIPKDERWSSFLLANPGPDIVRNIMLVTGDQSGKPLHTVYGPFDLNPYEKHNVMLENLPLRLHEYAKTESVKLIADQSVYMLNVFANPQEPMAGFAQVNAKGSHLVIPDTSHEMSRIRKVKATVFNESFTEAPVKFSVYESDGTLKTEISEVIPALGKFTIKPGKKPFYHTPDGGWIDVVALEGHLLTAFQYLTNEVGNKNAIETLFALPTTGESVKKIVPHITPVLGWWTTSLTLINPNPYMNVVNFHYMKAQNNQGEDVNLELTPYEKRVIDLSAEFGKFKGEALYRSSLELTAQYPIAGYYTYSAPSGGDEASYPLLNSGNFKNELVLPHYAGRGEYFWTAVCLCNPNSYPISIIMEPYNEAGEIIDEDVKTLSLAPGEYDVFTIRSWFGESASDFAYMIFRPEEPGTEIAGNYLFGNRREGLVSVEMLFGANM